MGLMKSIIETVAQFMPEAAAWSDRLPLHVAEITLPPAEAHVGRRLAFVALLLLIAGMLVLARHTAGSETWMLLQELLFAQLVALLLWMGISYKRLL